MTALAGAEDRAAPNRTLFILALGALAYTLAQTMIVPALPAIQRELHTSAANVTWLLTAFLVSASIATPIIGRLGDMYGKERLLLFALLLFGAGNLIAAFGHSLGVYIAGRAVQGMGGAILPLAIGIIRDEFPREKVATGIGTISAMFGIGGGIGLVVSGVTGRPPRPRAATAAWPPAGARSASASRRGPAATSRRARAWPPDACGPPR